MRKELWRRTTRKIGRWEDNLTPGAVQLCQTNLIQDGRWHRESSGLSMCSHQYKVSFKRLLYQSTKSLFCFIFQVWWRWRHQNFSKKRRRLWHQWIGWEEVVGPTIQTHLSLPLRCKLLKVKNNIEVWNLSWAFWSIQYKLSIWTCFYHRSWNEGSPEVGESFKTRFLDKVQNDKQKMSAIRYKIWSWGYD